MEVLIYLAIGGQIDDVRNVEVGVCKEVVQAIYLVMIISLTAHMYRLHPCILVSSI